jgi:hypothetical protein
MYARLGERTPLSLVRTYVGGPSDVRFANSTADVRVEPFFKYPLGNTWTYKTLFRPLCNSTGHTLGLAGRPMLCQGVRGDLCNTPIKTHLFIRQNLFHRTNQQRFSIKVFNETLKPLALA